jgi:hypothetical protein
MIAWSTFAVAGVYVWASAPLVVAAATLAAAFRPRIGSSTETRLLDHALVASAVAVALQLSPLPLSLLTFISPKAETVRSGLLLRSVPEAAQGWAPASLAPGSTAYALALVVTSLVVFWTARQVCAQGGTRPLVRAVAMIGLLAAVVAIVQQAGDPTLIYGRWMPRDEGARPFGPFVNRNHFATWVLMAFPLAAGYVAASVSAHKPGRRIASEMAAVLQGLGGSAAWAAAAAAVMTIGLMASTSRSGLIGLSVSLIAAAWIGRRRMDRRARLWGLTGAMVFATVVFAYVNLQPLLQRVEETLTVGAGGRPQIWRQTLPMVHDFWMTGTGLGTYQTAMLVYQQMNRAVFVNQAHNQYLQLLAEGGLLAAVPVLTSLFAFFGLFRRRFRADSSPSAWIRIGAITGIVAVAVQSFWETGLRMPANGVLFAVAAAIAVHRPAGGRARGE